MEHSLNVKSNDNKKNFQGENKALNKSVGDVCNFAGMKLKNRFVFANLADNEFNLAENLLDNYFDFYQRLAIKDIGMIFTGGVYDVCEKTSVYKIPKLHQNDKKKFLDFTQNIHTSGSKIALTIKSGYGRSNENFKFMGALNLSASFNVNQNDSRMICARISDQKINDIIERIKRCSRFAKDVGFDAVLVDGTIDEILGELSSMEFNRRMFGYFSDISDLAEKLIKTVVDAVGMFPIFYKINIGTFFNEIYGKRIKNIATLQGVNKFSTKSKIVKLMSKMIQFGVDGFFIETGAKETEFISNIPALYDDEFVSEYIEDVVDEFKKLNLKNKFGEEVKFIIDNQLQKLNNKNDFLLNITKNIYADEDFSIKQKTQKLVKNCIKCNKCIDFIQKYNKIACAINPKFLDNDQLKNKREFEPVAIIGAGISGLQCALTLSQRGFVVDLYEKENDINFKGRLFEVFGFDENMKKYNDYLKVNILKNAKNQQINLKTNHYFAYDAILLKEYKTIIVATGAREKFFSVNGAVQKHVKSIYEILSSNKHIININTVAIYAKTELSFKLALYLLKQNKKVSLIIPDLNFLFEMPNANLIFYLTQFKELCVDVNLLARVKKIHDDSADIFVNNKFKNKDFVSLVLNLKSKRNYKYVAELKTIDADIFVYEPELVPNNKLYIDLISNRFKGNVYLIGDALQVGDLSDAVRTGYYVGKNI